MDLEKCKRETSAKDSLWKENLKVPSEAGLLRFTFVPSFGRLPTQFHIADAATFLGVAERTLDKNSQECATNRTDTLAEDKALGKESKVEATSPTNSHCKSFHLEGHKTGRGEMEGNDLFKAEFVFITDSDEDTQAAAGDDHGGAKISETSCVSVGGESRGQLDAPQVPLQTELPAGSASQQKHAQIKTSYKAFAAIPTNTLLQEQKALDEPIKAEEEAENRVLDTHSEICSPALLRQQTEELCAAIDQVLQNPLSVNQSDSSPSSVQNILDSNIGKANLYVSGSAVPEGPKTKPGVIRPTIVKAKIMVQEEEPVQPNPFKKYLEETNDPETEQDSSVFQPFFHTKLNPSTKSPLYPQQASSHADPLTPGPLNHLGSILRDNHDNSYSLYYRNTLYNKPNHPIVPIPENEALSSEELSSLVYHEEQDLSKGDFPDNGRLHNKDQCRLRRELGNSSAKPS
uniref:Muscular LMNA interacting protein n=1 Tax=Varanus komodoensis TaxID=61221 RepID=A0A8D2IIP1_VARKO